MARVAALVIAGVVLIAASVSVAGCGRRASPDAPPGATYPRTYPSR